MLILTRKSGQSIRIGGNIIVTVIRSHGAIKLGIDAPKDIPIWRSEITLQGKAGDDESEK